MWFIGEIFNSLKEKVTNIFSNLRTFVKKGNSFPISTNNYDQLLPKKKTFYIWNLFKCLIIGYKHSMEIVVWMTIIYWIRPSIWERSIYEKNPPFKVSFGKFLWDLININGSVCFPYFCHAVLLNFWFYLWFDTNISKV